MTEVRDATEVILELLFEIRPEADYRTSKNFLPEGLMNSFDIVTLVHDLDLTFEISIDGADIVPDHFTSLEAIRTLLRKNGVCG